MEAGIEQGTGNGADEQGAVHFLGDEGQTDSDDGGTSAQNVPNIRFTS